MSGLPPVTTIRPNLPPPAAPQSHGLDPARQAAQRAFFAAALGQAQAPAAAAATPRPAEPPPQAPSRTPDPGAEAPQRILRPGSLLDIRV